MSAANLRTASPLVPRDLDGQRFVDNRYRRFARCGRRVGAPVMVLRCEHEASSIKSDCLDDAVYAGRS